MSTPPVVSYVLLFCTACVFAQSPNFLANFALADGTWCGNCASSERSEADGDGVGCEVPHLEACVCDIEPSCCSSSGDGASWTNACVEVMFEQCDVTCVPSTDTSFRLHKIAPRTLNLSTYGDANVHNPDRVRDRFVLAEDFNNDSKVDLLLWFVDPFSAQERGTVYFLENLGGEEFGEPIEVAANFTELFDGSDLIAADVNQDGFLDVVVVNGVANTAASMANFAVDRTGFFVLKNLFGEIDTDADADAGAMKLFDEPLFFESPLDRPEFVVTDLNGDGAPDIMGIGGVLEACADAPRECRDEEVDALNPLVVHLNLNHRDGSVAFAAAEYLWTATATDDRQGARFAGLVDANNDGVYDVVTQTRYDESDRTYVEFGTGLATNDVSQLFELSTPWETTQSERSALRAFDSDIRQKRLFHPYVFAKLGNHDIDAMIIPTKSTNLYADGALQDRGAFRWTPANPDWNPQDPTSELYPLDNTFEWGQSLGHVDDDGDFKIFDRGGISPEMRADRQNFVNVADLNNDGQVDVFDQVGVYFGIDTTLDARRFTPLVPYDKLGMESLVPEFENVPQNSNAFERTYYTKSQPRVADLNGDGFPDVILPTQSDLLVFYTAAVPSTPTPTSQPSAMPTVQPTAVPTRSPSSMPTTSPSPMPTSPPSPAKTTVIYTGQEPSPAATPSPTPSEEVIVESTDSDEQSSSFASSPLSLASYIVVGLAALLYVSSLLVEWGYKHRRRRGDDNEELHSVDTDYLSSLESHGSTASTSSIIVKAKPSSRRTGKHVYIIFIGLAVLDLIIDWAFIVEAFRLSSANALAPGNALVSYLPTLAVLFALLAFVVNCGFILSLAMRELNNAEVVQWFGRHWLVATLAIVLSMANPVVLSLLVSRTFGQLDAFNAPLSRKTRDQIFRVGFISTLVRDGPLLAVQLTLFLSVSAFNVVALVAAVMSCFSLVASVARCCLSTASYNDGVAAPSRGPMVRLPTRLRPRVPASRRAATPKLTPSLSSSRGSRVEMGKLRRTLTAGSNVDASVHYSGSDIESGPSTGSRSRSRSRSRPRLPVHAPASPLAVSRPNRLTPRTSHRRRSTKSLYSQRHTPRSGTPDSHMRTSSSVPMQELDLPQKLAPHSPQRHAPVRTQPLLSMQELERTQRRAKLVRTDTLTSTTLHSIQEEHHTNLTRANSESKGLLLEREFDRCPSTRATRKADPSRLSPHLVSSERATPTDSVRHQPPEELDSVRLDSLRGSRFRSLRSVFASSPSMKSRANDTSSAHSATPNTATEFAGARDVVTPPSLIEKDGVRVSFPYATSSASDTTFAGAPSVPSPPSLRRQRSKSYDFSQLQKLSTKSQPSSSHSSPNPRARTRSMSLTESITKSVMLNAAMRLTGFFSLVENLQLPSSMDPSSPRQTSASCSRRSSLSESIKIVRRLSKSLSQSRRNSFSDTVNRSRHQSPSAPRTPPTIHETPDDTFSINKCSSPSFEAEVTRPSYTTRTTPTSPVSGANSKRLSRSEALKAIQALNASLNAVSSKSRPCDSGEDVVYPLAADPSPSPPPPHLVKRLSTRDALRFTDALKGAGRMANIISDNANTSSSQDANLFFVKKRRGVPRASTPTLHRRHTSSGELPEGFEMCEPSWRVTAAAR